MKVKVMELLEGQALFPGLEELHQALDGNSSTKSHRYHLMDAIIKFFLKTRLFHHGKQLTQEQKSKQIRQKCHKLVHFNNQ